MKKKTQLKTWKPSENERIWAVVTDLDVLSWIYYSGGIMPERLVEVNNYFRTKSLALQASKAIKLTLKNLNHG